MPAKRSMTPCRIADAERVSGGSLSATRRWGRGLGGEIAGACSLASSRRKSRRATKRLRQRLISRGVRPPPARRAA